MGRDAEQHLKVWSWTGRDRSSLHDLEVVVAVAARRDLQVASVRLSLPKPDCLRRVKERDPEYDLAVAAPGRVFWRDIDQRDCWYDEDDLAALRQGSNYRELRAGRYVTPVQRED